MYTTTSHCRRQCFLWLILASCSDYVAVLAAVLFQSGAANKQDNLYYMLGELIILSPLK